MEYKDNKNHIFLTGFMAAGKTSVGKILAQKLSMPFLDADYMIEKRAGMSVSDIFEKQGENAFRTMEMDFIRRVLSFEPSVIALGGGAFLSSENRKLILETGITIALSWPEDILLGRISSGHGRPLLKGLNKKAMSEKISSLLQEREKIYRKADIYLYFSEPVKQEHIAEIIIQYLKEPEWKR
ncbi:shikimate kinase [bacterium]|nr:shikimate kinase [bacterium]